MSRAGSIARGVALGVTLGVGASACESAECDENDDCAVGFDCTLDGVCVTTPQGEIRWVSPEPGSLVPPRFDAVVEVSFRAPSATITIDRDVVEVGEPCAPFIPAVVDVEGDVDEALVQQVTLPGLFALGPSFGVSAVLNAAGGTRSVRLSFAGEPTGYGGARFLSPEAGVLDASSALSMPVSATFDRAATRALLSVEPVDGESPPSPRQLVGGGILEVQARAPLARGPQIVWLDTEDTQGAHRCGRGVSGDTPAALVIGAGVELGLFFEGTDAGQLDLRVQVQGADGDAVCTFVEPGEACTAVYESKAPTRAGDEVLRVDAIQDGVIEVLVVPGAAGPSMTARVRVSNNGTHVGWLGPFPLQPSLGEVWRAGRIVIAGSLARIEPIDELLIGAPF